MVRKKRPITRTPTKRYYKVNGKRRLYKVWRENGKVKRQLVRRGSGKIGRQSGHGSLGADNIYWRSNRSTHRQLGGMRTEKKIGENTYGYAGLDADKGIYAGAEYRINKKNKLNAEVNTKDGASLEITHKTPAGNFYGKITPTGPKLGATIDRPRTRKAGGREGRIKNKNWL